MSSEEGPLSRWSRRKAAQRGKQGGAAPAIEEAPAAALPAQSGAASGTEPPPDLPDLDLPDIETLTGESDFAQFMKEGVPKHLRTLALRKLWASDPAFNVIDEMVEYGEDFTDGGALIANLKDVLEGAKDKFSEGKDEAAGDDEVAEEIGEPAPAGEVETDTAAESDGDPDSEDGETGART